MYLALASAVSILLSIAVSQILLGLALAALFVSGTKLRLPPIWLPLGLFLLGTLISCLASVDPRAGLPQIRKFFVFTVLLVIFSTVRDLVNARVLMLCWAIVGSVDAGRGIYQYLRKVHEAHVLGRNFYEYYVGERITGFMSHWMTYTGQELMVLLMLLAFLMYGPLGRRRNAIAWGFCATLLLTVLALGGTRGIWAAFAVSGFYLLWTWNWKVALAAPLLALTLIWFTPGFVHERFVSIFQPKKETDSNQHRVVTWRTGIRMIEAHPWLGLGPEEVKAQFMDYVPADIPRPLPTGWYGHLHNIYLHYAAERGIPTMLMLLWMLVQILFDYARALRRLAPGRGDQRFLLQGGLACVIATMVSGLSELNLGDSEVLTVFLVVVACGYLAAEKSARVAA